MRLVVNATIVDAAPTGLGLYTRSVTRQLAGLGVEVLAYSSVGGWDGALPLTIRPAPSWTRPSRGLARYLARAFWIHVVFRSALRSESAECLLSPTPLDAMIRAPFPQVVVVHDCIPLRYPRSYQQQYYYFRWIVPHLLRTAARIVTVSEATRGDVLRFYRLNPARVTVVHNGLDWERVASLHRPPGGAGGTPYLLYVGNLHPHKNLHRLLEAFARSRAAREYHLYLVGRQDRRYYPRLLHRAAALGLTDRLRFLDYQDNHRVWLLLKRAKALVFPSLYEGFGLPPLEAMALGTPVVASRIPSVEEVCGEAVLYVDPSSVADMARGLDEILNDHGRRLHLIEIGQRQAGKFSWEETAKRLLQIFAEVTGH